MALDDEVKARYSTEYLARLSNLGENVANDEINVTRLDQACTDASAEFETLVQDELDLSNTRHLRVATTLVEVLLIEWGAGGSDHAAAMRSKAETMAERLRKTSSRARIVPTTDSVVTPTVETPHKGWADKRAFDGLHVNPPGYSDED